MQKKRALMYGLLGLVTSIMTCVILVNALAYTERSEVSVTTSFTIGGQEQKAKAFYLSAPAERLYITFNVSNGSIKFSLWDACFFEEWDGYFEYHNGTGVEKVQYWHVEGNNGTAGFSTTGNLDAGQVMYIQFYNEDSHEKEVHIQVTKVWKEQNYQSWI